MKPRKFDNQADAIGFAATKTRSQPDYDWYVIAAGDTDLWYVQRGGDYPQLYNGAQIIWVNGDFTSVHRGMDVYGACGCYGGARAS